ncbi:MAG: hypothetical protein JWQ04_2398 [Pedosphaera sp.]|nr:hypothetical protein [Pedosphaera sp.]
MIRYLSMRTKRFLHFDLPDGPHPVSTHRAAVFDENYYLRESVCGENPFYPEPGRNVAVSWMEADTGPSEIEVVSCATHESSSTEESSAIEHTSSPTPAAFSLAHPGTAEKYPAAGSAWSQGHSH